jgi:hypothetical protein
MQKNVLITNGRSPAGLDLLRSFQKEGHQVFIAESLPLHLCQFSRYGRCFKVPSPAQEPKEYIKALKQIVIDHSIDIIFPIYEEIFTLSHYKQEFDGICEVLCSNFSLLKQLHNKYEFIDLCKEYGLNHPRTELLYSADHLECYERKVIKPLYSRYGTDVYIEPSCETLNKLDYSSPWVLQEFVEGQTYCVYCFADNGKILSFINYPMEITITNVCMSMRHEENAEIYKWVEKFIKMSGASGSISFDIILKDSKVYPLECNPRVTSGIHVLCREQSFISSVLYKNPKVKNAYKPVMLGAFVFLKALVNWSNWRVFFNSKDVVFRVKDPLPVIGQFIGAFYFCILSIKHRKSISVVSTLDIEWNGEDL